MPDGRPGGSEMCMVPGCRAVATCMTSVDTVAVTTCGRHGEAVAVVAGSLHERGLEVLLAAVGRMDHDPGTERDIA